MAAGPLVLRIVCNGLNAALYDEQNGKTACVAKDVDLNFLSTEITGGFTGCTVGMYASANGTASTNHAAFYWFAYQQVRNKLR